jgi:hypothetical protein
MAVTHGGRARRFRWSFANGTLRIENESELRHTFSVAEVHSLLAVLRREFGEHWFPLANNVEKKTLGDPDSPTLWYEFFSELRDIQGNSSNDLSFVATLLAKRYLSQHFQISFCAAEKPQGAPGIDIDCRTPAGERIVGEIKTTKPYQRRRCFHHSH